MKQAKMMLKTITCMTSVSAILMECYVNRQTRKDDFTMKCIVEAAIFENSVSGMIPVSCCKIYKMVECGYPRLEVNEVGFCWISLTIVAL